MPNTSFEERVEITRLISRLSDDVHAVKGAAAANNSFIREVLERLEAMAERQAKTDTKLDEMTATNAEMLEVFNAGKTGVRFFQRAGKFLNRLARWVTPIIIAGGAVWALLHGEPPRGH